MIVLVKSKVVIHFPLDPELWLFLQMTPHSGCVPHIKVIFSPLGKSFVIPSLTEGERLSKVIKAHENALHQPPPKTAPEVKIDESRRLAPSGVLH